ncbi:MAG: RNA polymerase-binding protein DksA [Alphaproteobacteria bacterium]
MAKKETNNPQDARQTAVLLPPEYKLDSKDTYMSPMHLEYFRQKLLAWKKTILEDSVNTLKELEAEEGLQESDVADRASLETEYGLELRTRDRERKLISKIDAALDRIRNKDYGYCEETDEPIGLARLDARPIATLCIEAQEQHERKEKTRRDLGDVHKD